MRRKLIDSLVAHGVRAQLRSGSLLTGALFVAFDFFPDAPPATVDWSQNPVAAADHAGRARRRSRRSVASIIKKLDKMPFKAIGDDLRKTIVELDRRSASARGDARQRRHARSQRRRSRRARRGARQHAPGGEPRGARRCACSPTTSSAIPRRSSAARPGRRSDDGPDARICSAIALVAGARPRGCASAPSRFYTLELDGDRRRRAGRALRRHRRAGVGAGRGRPAGVRRAGRRRTASRSTSSTAGRRRSTTASRAPSPATSPCCSARRDVATGAARQLRRRPTG